MIGVTVMAIATLGGCKFYTKEDLSEYTKRRLKEEYGEEFEIKTVIDGRHTIAYPIKNPELLFETTYVISNGNGHNQYIQETVAFQYKKLIIEKFKDFQYNFHVDVDISWTELTRANPNITISEYDKLTNGIPQNIPRYAIYISCDALEKTDEYLFDFLESIAYIHDCSFNVYFVTNEDLAAFKEYYTTYPQLSGSTYQLLEKYTWFEKEFPNYKFATLYSNVTKGEWDMDYEKFIIKMKEVRSNELYR